MQVHPFCSKRKPGTIVGREGRYNALESDRNSSTVVAEASTVRVAIVTSFPRDPEDPCGGIESVSVHLARALSQLGGLQLDIVTDDKDCSVLEKSQWGDIHIYRLPHPGRSKLGNAIGPGRRQMMRYLTQLSPDVIHAHGVYGMMVKGLSIPRVFTVHGLISREVRLFGDRMVALRSWLWKRMEQGGWADQPHVISINPYVREQIAGIVTGVIHDIDNPIGESCFNIDRREEPTRIFCAGAICSRKNTLGLLRGFAKLLGAGVRAELRISGGGDDDYLSQVRHFIRENGLTEHVNLLGRVNYDAIREEMSRAAVFTLVSLEESSPMAIEEAMAAGVPVVTSNRCGMPHMVQDGASGYLVDPSDPDDIALRLGQLLEDNELRRSMGQKSREIAKERFHPEAVARRTVEVYRRAIRDNERRQGRPVSH